MIRDSIYGDIPEGDCNVEWKEDMSGVSMEEFGPVSADYFNQRRVEDVVEHMNAKPGEPIWTIKYEGGGMLHNFDIKIPTPKAIKGAAQTMLILGAHASGGANDGNPVTELRFGLETVFLNPTEYAIVDPVFTKGQMVYAQRSRANMPTPPHPDERVADGPSEDWLAGNADPGDETG